MSHQVFVSYSSADEERVDDLLYILKARAEAVMNGRESLPDVGSEFGRGNRGFTFWRDKDGILAGEPWSKVLDEEIEKSFAVLVMLSKNSVESHYVTYEWSYAKGLGLKVFTLQIDSDVPDDKIHQKLKEVQYITRPGNDNWWKDILVGLDREQVNFLSEGLGKHIAILLENARLQKDHQNYENAIATFMDVEQIATPSYRDDIWYEIADCHLLNRDEQKRTALEYYERYHDASSESEKQEMYDRAQKKEKAAEVSLTKAREALKNALMLNNEHTRSLILQAELFREESELAQNPDRRRVHLENALKKFQLAIEYNEGALDNDGESIYGSLGGIYNRLNMRDEAIEAYKNAVRIRRSSYPLGNLALLFMDFDMNEMVRYFRQVEKFARARTEKSPNDMWAYNDLFLSQIAEVHSRELDEDYNDTMFARAKSNARDTLTYLELFKEYTEYRVVSRLVSTLERMAEKDFSPTAKMLITDAINILSEEV